MCVIAVCEKRRLTTAETIQMDCANPHGIGIAWLNRKQRRVEYAKGLTVEQAVSRVATLPLPYVAHFRLASVGAIGTPLCHPFPVERAPRTDARGTAAAVLFHNGTWPDWRTGQALVAEQFGVDVDAAGPWSDSRVMAALLTEFPPDVLHDVIGATQRIAVLRANGTIALQGEFAKHRGIRVSNFWWRDIPMARVAVERRGPSAWERDRCAAPKKKPATTAAAEKKTDPTPQPLDCTLPLFDDAEARRIFGAPRVPRPARPAFLGGRR